MKNNFNSIAKKRFFNSAVFVTIFATSVFTPTKFYSLTVNNEEIIEKKVALNNASVFYNSTPSKNILILASVGTTAREGVEVVAKEGAEKIGTILIKVGEVLVPLGAVGAVGTILVSIGQAIGGDN